MLGEVLFTPGHLMPWPYCWGFPPNTSNADLGKSADASQSIIVGYPCIRVPVTWTFGRPSSAYQPLYTFTKRSLQHFLCCDAETCPGPQDPQISLALRLGLVHIVSVL